MDYNEYIYQLFIDNNQQSNEYNNNNQQQSEYNNNNQQSNEYNNNNQQSNESNNKKCNTLYNEITLNQTIELLSSCC